MMMKKRKKKRKRERGRKKDQRKRKCVGANLVIFFSDFKIQVIFLRLAHDNAFIVVDTDLLQGG